MTADNLRNILRAATSALHDKLDSAVGEFGSKPAYVDYVRKTHRFRFAVEQVLTGNGGNDWHVDAIHGVAAQDLADLGVPELPHASFQTQNWTRPSWLGAHYVLEGSSLGARLLLKRAEALGLGVDFGARHLAHQAADHQRWRDFLAKLDTVPVEMHDAAVNAAEDMFRFALSIYTESAHEYA